MNELNFQKIMDILQMVLPNEWEKIIFYAEYTEGSYSMKYYANCGDGKYVDCYSIASHSKAQLVKAFMAIDKELSAVRKELNEKDKWSVITLIVDKSGTFKADYDYSKIDGSTIEFHENWERKYLK